MAVAIYRESGRWPVLHGDHIAFVLLARLRVGDQINATHVELPSGAHPIAGSPIVCGTCGEPFDWTGAIRDALTQRAYAEKG